jgi:hypothetical protein
MAPKQKRLRRDNVEQVITFLVGIAGQVVKIIIELVRVF